MLYCFTCQGNLVTVSSNRTELPCRIKMCRRVAHKASTTAATVAGGVADTSIRVADAMVSRMGGSSYGQYASPPLFTLLPLTLHQYCCP